MIFFSCGGSLQSTDSAPEIPADASQFERNGLVFDPFATQPENSLGIPFPNDLFLKPSETKSDENSTERFVEIDTSNIEDSAAKAFYEAINSLKLPGFSPNTPIAIPLVTDSIQLDMNSVKDNVKLFDLTALASNDTLSIDQTDRLEIVQDGSYLKLYPIRPLEAGHKYVVVLLNGIKDIKGKLIVAPQVYDSLESDEPLANPDLEELRLTYREKLYNGAFPAINQILGETLNKDTVLEAFTFTTANKTLSFDDFLKIADGNVTGVEGLTYDNITIEYETNFDTDINKVLNLINGTDWLKSRIKDNREFPAFDITRLFYLKSMTSDFTQSLNETIAGNFIKFIPVSIFNGNLYDSSNGTVYIFQHGLGGNRTNAMALLDDIQLPVVAIDLPFHGDYTTLTESDNGTYQFLSTDMPRTRLNIYQAVFNLRLLEELLKGGFYDIDGDNVTDNVTTVNFLGMSMGAIVGSIYANYGSPNKVVLNVGGANYVSILDTATNQMIQSLLSSAGIKKNTNAYFLTLGIFQTMLDPADPIYIGAGEDKKDKIILQTAYGDTIVPNISNEILATRIGFNNDNFTYQIVDSGNQLSTNPGWYIFGNETNWVNHGFLLLNSNLSTYYPEAAEYLDETFVSNAQDSARKQINEFFTQ
jgi:pimeloyl-ACP methyl ester carboxylesterase